MHADICEADDAATIARFRSVLAAFGAVKVDQGWAIGVDRWRYRIDGDLLDVFSDAWSVDVEGPMELVERIVDAVRSSAA